MSTEEIQALLSNLMALGTEWGLQLIYALAILFIGRKVARWVRRLVKRLMGRADADATLIPFVSSLVYYAVLAFVVLAVLNQVGFQTASMVAVLGAAGLAVGLALQGTLSNFASGVMLLVFRPFHVGDFISAGGESGSVQAIGLFSTTLNTGDNVQIVIPNSSVYGGTIKNFGANPTRRNDFDIGISYDDDIDIAMRTINKLLDADDRVLADPEALVAVKELGDSAVILVVRAWCRREDYWPLRFGLMKQFKQELEAAGCSFPYPQQDVHMHQVVGASAA
jgi:small conductance mechanosensitive channel